MATILKQLISHLYDYNYSADNKHQLDSVTKTAGGITQRLEYGNGDFEAYEYDQLDRLVKVYYNGNEEPTYFVTFDTNGRVSSVKDGNITHIYEYDSLGRLIRAYQKNNAGTTLLAVENTYDEYGRALGSTYDIDPIVVYGDKYPSHIKQDYYDFGILISNSVEIQYYLKPAGMSHWLNDKLSIFE